MKTAATMISVTETEASTICHPHPLPPSGYMQAVKLPDGRKAWLRNLKVSGCLLVQPVESFLAGVGIGALRKMYS